LKQLQFTAEPDRCDARSIGGVAAYDNKASVVGVGFDREGMSCGVEDVVDDDRACLDLAASVGWEVAGTVGPGDTQLGDTRAVDLIESGVARVSWLASDDVPIIRSGVARCTTDRPE
jgi:hypothetical protein